MAQSGGADSPATPEEGAQTDGKTIQVKVKNQCSADRMIKIGQGPYYTVYRGKTMEFDMTVGHKIYLYEPKKEEKVYATVEESHSGKTLTLCQ
jgi:hypothetical protein